MKDNYDLLVNAVVAIKSDAELKQSFNKILQVGSFSQQVRVEKIRQEIEPLNPPKSVTSILELLKNDKLAGLVLNAINEA